MVAQTRISEGREGKTTFIIIDAQSVKNSDTAEQKGYDAGKKVSGIKRHIAVDSQGLPHGVLVTTADITDRTGALEMFKIHKKGLNKLLNILADGGYSGKKFANAVADIRPIR